MADIDERGIQAIVKESITYLQSKTDGIHLSLDIDALDPSEVPGTGTKVPGGLITSLDIVEVNPLLDIENRTAEQAVALLGSFFGETLL